jgi:hypothetical protein
VVNHLAQRFHERLVGHPEVLVAAADQHHRPLGVDSLGQLCGQAGLADPRLASQQRQPWTTGDCLLPELAQALHLRLATHKDTANVGEQGR